MVEQIIDSSIQDISSARILLVDDDQLNTAILRNAFDNFNNVYSAHSGEEAIEFCQKALPDLILLDVMMPGLDGYTTCKILRTIEGMDDCPIVFSTALTGMEEELKCWEAGGTDFVSKPVSPTTLLKHVQAHIRLKLQCNELRSLAIYDSRTGLRNRRYFDDYYNQQMHVSRRDNTDLSIVVVDIDYFESYRDCYGQAEGDLCLKRLAKTVSGQLNYPTDAAIRYDEEKIVMILPNTDIKGAKHVANEIICQFEKLEIPNSQAPQGIVKISAGLASYATTEEGEDIFTSADRRLNSIKNANRSLSA